MKALDLTGCTFGRLTVLRLVTGDVGRKWVCQCQCGTIKVCPTKALRRGNVRSCGCLRVETTAERNFKHGLYGTLAYKKWQGMWRRVRAPTGKSTCYAGLSICKEWADFTTFYREMGPCAEGESLDRIDNSKGYNKANCRWVPLAAQAANTSRNVFVTVNGERTHLSAAARANGLDTDVVSDRVNKLGWDVARALNTPVRKLTKKRTAR